MTKYYYHKRDWLKIRFITRSIGVCLFSIGMIGLIYVFFPLVMWQLELAPAFASQDVTSPIPRKEILSNNSIASLLQTSLHMTNYSDASNWFPTAPTSQQNESHHEFYLSIPKLGIANAFVTNADNDLDHHLVNYAGTAMPPQKGTSVVFGHSTLVQWFDPHNYKAIFATALNLQVGDKVVATVNGALYSYVIDKIDVVDADDTSPLQQEFDDSYLTIITCTPPGTTWKRLVIHSHLEKLTDNSLK